MKPPASPPAAPASASGLAVLARQARAQLDRLLAQSTAAAARTTEAAAALTRQVEARTAETAAADPVYGVFQVGTPERFMVLRDVETLDGKKPVATTPEFARALQLANQRLSDPVRADSTRIPWSILLRALKRFDHTLERVERDNERLAGSGTASEPYVVGAGHALFARASVNFVFPGVDPAKLQFEARGHRLLVTVAP